MDRIEDERLTEADVFWPFYHAGEIAARLDVLTDSEIARTLFDEGILWWMMPFSDDLLGQEKVSWTYLGSLLCRTGLPLGEGRRGGFAAGWFGRLSLRKEDQRNGFTKVL